METETGSSFTSLRFSSEHLSVFPLYFLFFFLSFILNTGSLLCTCFTLALNIPLLSSKLSMYSFSVEEHALYEIEFISQRQGEETQVDPLSQSMFVEHHHVDDVGRTTN